MVQRSITLMSIVVEMVPGIQIGSISHKGMVEAEVVVAQIKVDQVYQAKYRLMPPPHRNPPNKVATPLSQEMLFHLLRH